MGSVEKFLSEPCPCPTEDILQAWIADGTEDQEDGRPSRGAEVDDFSGRGGSRREAFTK